MLKSEFIFIFQVSVGCSFAILIDRGIRLILNYLFQKSETLNSNSKDEILLLLKEYEDKKAIKFLKKDDFDLKYGHFVETGFMTPEEYYHLKEMFHKGFLS